MNPKPVTLAGRSVRLEPLHFEHAEDLFSALSLAPEVWRYRPIMPPTDFQGMAALVSADLHGQESGSSVFFAQIDLSSGRAVGSTCYLSINRKDSSLEIGATWLGKPWQRTGLNREAKFLLLRHAFESLGAVRVQFKTDSRNTQSQLAIERLGAVREGHLRKHMLMPDGFWRDSVVYSILVEEWPAVRAQLSKLLFDSNAMASGKGLAASLVSSGT